MRKNDIQMLSEAYSKKVIKEDLFDTNFDKGEYGDAFDGVVDTTADKQKFIDAKIIGIERLNDDYDSQSGEADSITILTDKGNIVIGSSDDLMVEYNYDGLEVGGDSFGFDDDDEFGDSVLDDDEEF